MKIDQCDVRVYVCMSVSIKRERERERDILIGDET